MKNHFFPAMTGWIRVRSNVILKKVIGTLIVLCVGAQAKLVSAGEDKDLIGVGITGVQHIGRDFIISEFYVNGYWGGNVGREGGGGGSVCCVMLPLKWRAGLVAEVRWSVADWSNEKKIEIKAGNYRSVTWKNYKALVPIEKYESAEQLYVHFFPIGKVRAVSSIFGSNGRGHPIHREDTKAATNATTGHLMDSMFTESELEEMKRESSKEETERGNWK